MINFLWVFSGRGSEGHMVSLPLYLTDCTFLTIIISYSVVKKFTEDISLVSGERGVLTSAMFQIVMFQQNRKLSP